MSYKKKTQKEFNNLRNKVIEQKEFFTKEIEIIKRIIKQIRELKNPIKEKMNAIEGMG